MGLARDRGRLASSALAVRGGNVHPDWFATLAHRRLTRAGWQLDLRVTAGGHALSFGSGRARLVEWLAPSDADELPGESLWRASLRRPRIATVRTRGVIYQVNSEVERLDTEILRHLDDELTSEVPRCGLAYHYPRAGRLDPSATSWIDADPVPRGVAVRTVHTFPAERAVLRTQSLFEIEEITP